MNIQMKKQVQAIYFNDSNNESSTNKERVANKATQQTKTQAILVNVNHFTGVAQFTIISQFIIIFISNS